MCKPKVGATDNLVGVISENLKGHGMASAFSDTDEVTTLFGGARGKAGTVVFELNSSPEGKTEQRAYVSGVAGSKSERDGLEVQVVGVIQEEAHILHTQEPTVIRSASAQEDGVGDAFYYLVAAFCRVLVLLIGFTLPVSNVESTKDVKNPFAEFRGGRITDELIHGATLADIVLKSVNKLGISFDAIHVGEV